MMPKKVAIMQPYFLPYLGYFQLLKLVDEFVIYDNIQFSKSGWFHRNRILEHNSIKYITLPLQKDSDFLNVNERCLATNFDIQRVKLLSRVKNAYHKAPYFDTVYPLIEAILFFDSHNLFDFTLNSLQKLCDYLAIDYTITVSSQVAVNHDLRGQDKVLAICKAVNGTVYVNPEGGIDLYSQSEFASNGIGLQFLTFKPQKYSQFSSSFQSHLSILDVMMHNSVQTIQTFLSDDYELK